MAKQLDCNLVDMCYVLDEPSTGLHPKDTEKLLALLYRLKDKGNSVFVVEHDPEIIRAAEWIIDIGPKAGKFGGEVVYKWPPRAGDILKWKASRVNICTASKKPYSKKKGTNRFFQITHGQCQQPQNVSSKHPERGC
ncbi:MAG: hypothetical protein IPO07_31485 [Haliscomenobacter sp.]|nr:hypothetical protein [Haliscomenobacter sp.]MBK9492800.1 hypothetical protein [Haliscomenobacter sp.]